MDKLFAILIIIYVCTSMFDNVKVYHENEGLCISEMHMIENKLRSEFIKLTKDFEKHKKDFEFAVLNLESENHALINNLKFYHWVLFELPLLYRIGKFFRILNYTKLLKIFNDKAYGNR